MLSMAPFESNSWIRKNQPICKEGKRVLLTLVPTDTVEESVHGPTFLTQKN